MDSRMELVDSTGTTKRPQEFSGGSEKGNSETSIVDIFLSIWTLNIVREEKAGTEKRFQRVTEDSGLDGYALRTVKSFDSTSMRSDTALSNKNEAFEGTLNW